MITERYADKKKKGRKKKKIIMDYPIGCFFNFMFSRYLLFREFLGQMLWAT